MQTGNRLGPLTWCLVFLVVSCGGKTSPTSHPGGASGTGGTTAMGGTTTAVGGTSSTGGTMAMGGTTTADGGTSGTGGTTVMGGVTTTVGGMSSTGGTSSPGGTPRLDMLPPGFGILLGPAGPGSLNRKLPLRRDGGGHDRSGGGLEQGGLDRGATHIVA